MTYRPLTLALLSVGFLSLQTQAAPSTARVIVLPACLTQSVSVPYTMLATDKTLNLLAVDDDVLPAFADAKHQTSTPCGGFMDVTEEWHTFQKQHALVSGKQAKTFLKSFHMEAESPAIAPNDYQIRYQTIVTKLLGTTDPNRMWSDLKTLSNFKNRNARSDYGVQAADWIKTQVADMAKSYGRDDVSIRLVATPGYKQPSVVAKIGTSNEAGIVIGAHMDTTSYFSERQPGADDDGSGSVTVLEVVRTLLASDVHFNKPIYAIWYAAEEAGLVGSKYVVQDFQQKKIPVSEVLHLDMTGFPDSQDPNAIWLITDYVHADLTNYMKQLINTYVKQPIGITKCGYACSDHASWTKAGFKAVIPTESAFERMNHDIHSANDTMDKLSLKHMSDYSKLGIAFVAELAEPVG